MNKTKLKAAVAKYADDYKSDPVTATEIIKSDFSEGDAEQLIEALSEPEEIPAEQPKVTLAPVPNPLDNPNTGTAPGRPTTYAVYDEFEARILKCEVLNPYTNRPETIITGWELGKKRHSKKIERHNAIYLNSYANGTNANEIFPLLVPVDSMRNGDIVSYNDWAAEQGKDLAKDINILLNPSTTKP